ncbi:hypothetical protein OPV22_028726 [Ensete ventricosum]|uniref:Uncharacterized protein n=1 Tax=Ensete ventricosum TaxID=4639 RepID=A0AAV8Q4I4_ENSVE|nr:hypothetical protein OPV22_028726 [Ensete ventricosum]
MALRLPAVPNESKPFCLTSLRVGIDAYDSRSMHVDRCTPVEGAYPRASVSIAVGSRSGTHGKKLRARLRALTTEQWASDLQVDKEKLIAQLVEVTNRLELSDRDLNDTRADLSEAQRELKEQWASRRKADNDLLNAIRELET